MSEEINLDAANDKIIELEAQVRVMRGIIVQAMLQNNREAPAEQKYKNQMPYTTSSTTQYGQYGTTVGQNINKTMEQNISQTLLDAMKPLVAFSKFSEPQA